MTKSTLPGAAALFVALAFVSPAARAQDADEVAALRAEVERLKQENEVLKKENEVLKKENDLLEKEVELLKREAESEPKGAKGPKAGTLSDLITEGTVLQGTFRAGQGGGHGDITLTVSERDGKRFKATLVLRHMQDNVEVGTAEGQAEGTIDRNRLSWANVGGATKINATLLLKGDGLEGTYRTQAGVSGTIGLRVAK